MAGRIVTFGVKALRTPKIPAGAVSMSGHHGVGAPDHTANIGKREVVGYGFNGQSIYCDREDFPFPAIRWKEPTTDLQGLREKEKGDWKKLSIAEKKDLYRSSFCQTFSEFKAPTGEWKSVIGIGLLFVSAALWLFYGANVFVYQPMPASFNEENRKAQLRRMLDLQVNPIQGISSKWDYEKEQWKK